MRILGVLFLLLLLVAGVGFYRGWFSMSRDNGNPVNHEVNVNLKVDRDKMEADENAVKDKFQELTSEAKDQADQLVQPKTEVSHPER